MATFIIGGIVAGAFVFAGYKVHKDHKKGGCGSGCSGCSENKNCHK